MWLKRSEMDLTKKMQFQFNLKSRKLASTEGHSWVPFGITELYIIYKINK